MSDPFEVTKTDNGAEIRFTENVTLDSMAVGGIGYEFVEPLSFESGDRMVFEFCGSFTPKVTIYQVRAECSEATIDIGYSDMKRGESDAVIAVNL